MTHHRRTSGYFFLGAFLILISWAQFAFSQTEPPGSAENYGVGVAKDVMVPMRDGVKLATDIYYPTKDGAPVPGKFPVLVSRTPYGKNPTPPPDGTMTPEQQNRQNPAAYFASRGYVVVLQDCRGRFNSEGMFYLDVNEGPDGYDTVEWAARQPWSNGKVGTYGASYLSQVQNALAALRPPHLAAMFGSAHHDKHRLIWRRCLSWWALPTTTRKAPTAAGRTLCCTICSTRCPSPPAARRLKKILPSEPLCWRH